MHEAAQVLLPKSIQQWPPTPQAISKIYFLLQVLLQLSQHRQAAAPMLLQMPPCSAHSKMLVPACERRRNERRYETRGFLRVSPLPGTLAHQSWAF